MFVLSTIVLITGFTGPSHAEWSVTLDVTLNSNPQLPLVFGKKAGATDNYEAGGDQLAAPQTPDGDTYYFRSITNQPSPLNNLLEDYRADNNSQANWRLALTAANTKTYIVSWNAGALPPGWGFTWQEANSSWVGTGAIHNFNEAPAQIQYTNTSGDILTRRYLITAVVPPLPFNKTSPADGAANQPTSLTLTWETSAGASSYEYCYDTSNNDTCNTSWTSAGTSTSVAVAGLTPLATYYWQVRARNAAGTLEASGGWWSFTAGDGQQSKTFLPFIVRP